MTARGIRNNNPGNIDRGATKWQGMADDQSSDPRFIVFKTPQYGIRAIARLMLTYQNQYGLKTVRGIVSRWAPPSENNTAAYVAAVATAMGVAADDPIDVESAAVMTPLVKAIILHEDAGYAYPDGVIAEGVRLAGVADAPAPKLASKPSVQAQAGATAAIAGAGCIQACAHFAGQAAAYAPQVKDAADKLSAFTGSPAIQHVVTVLLTVAGGLTAAGLAAEWLKHRSA